MNARNKQDHFRRVLPERIGVVSGVCVDGRMLLASGSAGSRILEHAGLSRYRDEQDCMLGKE